jgi:hypothetical protein
MHQLQVARVPLSLMALDGIMTEEPINLRAPNRLVSKAVLSSIWWLGLADLGN